MRQPKTATEITPEWVTTDQAAALVQVSVATIRRWVESGKLPATQLGHRRAIRIERAALAAFMADHPAKAS